MSYLSGVTDLATTFQRLGGAGSSAYKGDWVGFGTNLGAAAGKVGLYVSKNIAKESLTKIMKEAGSKALPTPTAIIDVTLLIAAAVDLLNGFGPPDAGSAFTSGIDKLKNADSSLEAAIPDQRDWDGDAAQAYAAQNAALRTLLTRMQELDKEMADIVASQGTMVQQAHTAISIIVLALTAAQGIAIALYFIPVYGVSISNAFQAAVAYVAGMTILGFELAALDDSSANGAKADATAAKYAALAADAVPTGTFAQIEMPGAAETKVAGFEAISDSMTGASALSDMPTVASLANLAGESASDQRAFLETLTTDGQSTAGETPDVTTPDTPAAPAFTMPPVTLPTLNQMNRTSGQLAQMSGHLSQHANLVNQMMGQVQQFASMGQQGQGAAAPAEEAAEEAAPEEATLAGDVEGAGAGTQAAERAPVDVAAVGAESDLGGPGRVL